MGTKSTIRPLQSMILYQCIAIGPASWVRQFTSGIIEYYAAWGRQSRPIVEQVLAFVLPNTGMITSVHHGSTRSTIRTMHPGQYTNV